jgi:uncharacterized protein
MKYLLMTACLYVFSLTSSLAQPVDILFGVKVKMRDGVQLNATIFKPNKQSESLPVIIQLTPYISDTYHQKGKYFANNGYVYALVDTRGRGSSEGVFDPFNQEAKDGHDIVEWMALQKYCNGKVTMAGGSYSGYVQWATAKETPIHLSTIVPVASVKPGFDFPLRNNISQSYIIQWLTYTSGKTGNSQLFADKDFWDNKFTERLKNGLAFRSLDSLVGNPSEIFQKWITHPTYDDFFKKMSPSVDQYAKINIPILSITGHYDGDQPGALSFYKEHMKFGSNNAKSNHYLIIGPWNHAGTRTPRKEVGGLIFGDSSLINMDNLHKEWFDFTMKNGKKPNFLKNKVAYFISNKNKWKYASTLDEIGKNQQQFYLNNANNLNQDVLHSGMLQGSISNNSLPDEYTYDPNKIVVPEIETENKDIPNNYLTSQKTAYSLGKTGLIYHSDTFDKETEVSGFFELKTYIETNVKDIDIEAIVYEIKSDGTSVALSGDIIRARYKDGLEKEILLKSGEINLFHFKNFNFISRVINKGSRLRLIISSPNTMDNQKNYCSGGIIANETAKDAQIANLKIYNNSKYPSVLLMPFMKE